MREPVVYERHKGLYERESPVNESKCVLNERECILNERASLYEILLYLHINLQFNSLSL